MEMPYRCLYTGKQRKSPIQRAWLVVWLCSSYQTFPSSLPNYLDSSALLCQYNCCRKINWGSEYPVTADLSNVSDEGDWLPVTGSSIWWSSVPMGRGSAKDISEGFTSMDSDKGLFWLWMDSCSLKELSSAVESGGVSGPAETEKRPEKNVQKLVHKFCKILPKTVRANTWCATGCLGSWDIGASMCCKARPAVSTMSALGITSAAACSVTTGRMMHSNLFSTWHGTEDNKPLTSQWTKDLWKKCNHESSLEIFHPRKSQKQSHIQASSFKWGSSVQSIICL